MPLVKPQDVKAQGWGSCPRTVDPRGYVLIRMPTHHRADIRGYVYEHVLVAEHSAGRALTVGEQARHRDGNPGNNHPDNILIHTPPDRTIEINCACGCGIRMPKFDSSGRTRRFVAGHNPQPAPSRDGLLAALGDSPARCLRVRDLTGIVGRGPSAVRQALSHMVKAGLVERPRVGYYRLPGSTAPFRPLAGRRPKSEWGSALPESHKEMLLDDFGGRCAYGCGRKATVWDHLIPWALGGRFSWPGNAVPACKSCNSAKGDSPPGPWVERAFLADYSAWAMEGVTSLAIAWGMADPEDFMTGADLSASPLHDEYPQAVSTR